MAPLVFKTSGAGTPRPVGSIPATSANRCLVRACDPPGSTRGERGHARKCAGVVEAAHVHEATTGDAVQTLGAARVGAAGLRRRWRLSSGRSGRGPTYRSRGTPSPPRRDPRDLRSARSSAWRSSRRRPGRPQKSPARSHRGHPGRMRHFPERTSGRTAVRRRARSQAARRDRPGRRFAEARHISARRNRRPRGTTRRVTSAGRWRRRSGPSSSSRR